MWLTEAEARKQTCPHIRYCVNELGVIQDKDQPIYTHSNCAGSDCKMAWRWIRVGETEHVPAGILVSPTGRLAQKNKDGEPDPLGYCGIAGRPDLGCCV